MPSIATTDKKAMNSLMAGEIARVSGKTASDNVAHEGPDGPDALTDHAEYVKIIENVLGDDKGSDSWAPNDLILD